MKFEASVRKLRQLAREIDEMPGGIHRDNMEHSVQKLQSFLKDEVPGWREAMDEYDAEPVE